NGMDAGYTRHLATPWGEEAKRLPLLFEEGAVAVVTDETRKRIRAGQWIEDSATCPEHRAQGCNTEAQVAGSEQTRVQHPGLLLHRIAEEQPVPQHHRSVH